MGFNSGFKGLRHEDATSYEKLICVFTLHNSMLQNKILNKKLTTLCSPE